MKKKRLSFNDDFELLYLRHEYIEKAQKLGKKLDPSLVKRYAGIVHTTAKIMYAKLKPNFQKCGFDEEDFIAITNLYMLSYMALYSIQTNPKEMDQVIAKRGHMDETEILRVDRNRLINFLRQRLLHCSTLFARKARNITVGEDLRGYYAETERTVVPVNKDLLLTDYKKYGYRKATVKEYKDAQKNAQASGVQEITDKKGFKIIKVEQLNQGLSEYDFQLLSQNDKGTFYNPPDVILENTEDEIALEAFKIRFDGLDRTAKRKLLKNFITKNKGDKSLQEELSLAKKMLKSKVVVV